MMLMEIRVLLIIVFLSSCSGTEMNSDCDVFISDSVYFCFEEIIVLDQLVEECASSHKNIYSNHIKFSRKMRIICENRIFKDVVLNSKEFQEINLELNEIIIEFNKTIVKNSSGHKIFEDYPVELITENKHCSIQLAKLYLMGRIRLFLNYLAINSCNREDNMNLYKPPVMKVKN